MTEKFLIKEFRYGYERRVNRSSRNMFPEMLQWFLLLDDDIKQHIIEHYNNGGDAQLEFLEYLGVFYHGWNHPMNR